MNRRNFLHTSAAATAALQIEKAGQAAPSKPAKSQPVLFKLGTQNDDSEAALKVFSALGVLNICSRLPSAKFDAAWSVEGLKKLRERVEAHGIVLDAVPLPLSSSYITKSENPNIMLGKSPERDREIDNICQMIKNAAQAGIPILKYNMTILGVVRSEATQGRGASKYSTFRYAEAKQEPPLTEAGPASVDQMWERITYFLNHVIPVANEYKVKMACHPHDPGMPEDFGFRGVHRVLGNVHGLKKFISIQESPYHGLNFCQGTVSEMLKDPNNELPDVIRYFGGRKKIFNVHFRNIKGGFLNFQETLPDVGDVNFVKIARVYREVGYDGLLMPDHVPRIEGDTNGAQAFAFCFGYIAALIQAVSQEA
jgi:mannonate dehydratase